MAREKRIPVPGTVLRLLSGGISIYQGQELHPDYHAGFHYPGGTVERALRHWDATLGEKQHDEYGYFYFLTPK